jgi:ABC-2 type transport system permease protein
MVIADILSGLVIPIPFFPKFMQVIANIFPFRYISDFPFRFYVGNISVEEALYSILIQILWIIILFFLGKLLMNKALKKAVVQGG